MRNRPTDSPPPERVKLEERLAWLERHVVEQDKAMLVLHEELARLRAEFKQLRERAAVPEGERDDPAARPPHY